MSRRSADITGNPKSLACLSSTAQDKDGQTLMHLASWLWNQKIVSVLIESGADVSA